MPMTMEGTPVSRSAPKRMKLAKCPRRSWRNRAVMSPTGIAITRARPTISPVPVIAVEIPPPGTPREPERG